jgi:hypothetical protein
MCKLGLEALSQPKPATAFLSPQKCFLANNHMYIIRVAFFHHFSSIFSPFSPNIDENERKNDGNHENDWKND